MMDTSLQVIMQEKIKMDISGLLVEKMILSILLDLRVSPHEIERVVKLTQM